MKLLLIVLLSAALLPAGEIILPSTTFDRTGIVRATYRMNSQVSGEGKLSIRWTDALGRTGEDRTIPISLTDEAEFTFPVDLRRAVAMRNELAVHFSLEGRNLKRPDKREEDAKIT